MAVYIARNKEDLKEDYSICEGIAGDTPVALWFFEQGFSRIQHWNQSVLLKLHGNVDVDIINNAIDYLVRHHDALRLNYSPQNGKLYFNNAHISKKNELIVHDLSSYSEEEQMLKVKQIGGALKGSIDIENDRMLKTCIFDLGSSGKLLLLSAHHLVVDGVSWRVILEDMVNLYEQMLNGKPFKLPGKTCSIQYWSESLKKYGNGQALEEIDFWNEVIEKDFAFPYDKDMESKETCGSHTVNASLSVEETSVFLGEANRAYNTKPDELVEIAMALTLHELTGKEDIVFELEGHGRESLFDEVDVSRTVGWFTTMYPVCLNVSDLKPGVQIKSLKEQLRKVPNRGLGYGVLKYLSGKITDKIRRDIRLNYLGEFDNIFDNGMFSLSDWDSGEDHGNNSHLTCAVEVNGMIVSQKLKLSFIYSPDKFETATIQAFADLYIRYLRTIINHCTNMDFTDFTVSDFDMISLTQDELDGLFC
jgi:non-ribosomal peptide synthase protein (TIGR01720 family)